MQDESTYGFSKADASDLLSQIGGSETDYREGLVRSSKGSVVAIATTGIAARSGTTVSSASCAAWKRSGSTISSAGFNITVYNLSTTAVASGAYIVATKTNIGYVAVWEDC